MAGLYIHIPFCKQKCHYCNFYSLATRKYRKEIFKALLKEIEIQYQYLRGEKLETVYFGGGTPSLYDPELLEELIQKAISVFGISDSPEITLEANPDDIAPQWLGKLSKTSVNRLSIGIQSFHDPDLKYLHRVHTGSEALNVVGVAKEFGFNNLSLDLIYGIPTLSEVSWLENLKTAISFYPAHISAYALTVETGTALDHLIKRGKYRAVDDEKSQKHFNLLRDFLSGNGYEHYEISNFALPGKYAKHNTSYWTGEKYLGIGPSAHSFDKSSRQWNVSNIQAYLDGIDSGKLNFEKEILTETQKINEYIMTSLRTMWGLDLHRIEKEYGLAYADDLRNRILIHEKSGKIMVNNEKLFITPQGKFYADGIAADLFFD